MHRARGFFTGRYLISTCTAQTVAKKNNHFIFQLSHNCWVTRRRNLPWLRQILEHELSNLQIPPNIPKHQTNQRHQIHRILLNARNRSNIGIAPSSFMQRLLSQSDAHSPCLAQMCIYIHPGHIPLSSFSAIFFSVQLEENHRATFYVLPRPVMCAFHFREKCKFVLKKVTYTTLAPFYHWKNNHLLHLLMQHCYHYLNHILKI